MPRPTADNWIVLGILGAMIAAAIFVVYLPQGRKLEQVRRSITSQKLALEINAKKAEVVPDMIRRIYELKRRYKGFDRRMPKRKELGGFLLEISRILDTEQLSNTQTKPGDPTREDLFHTLPIIMKFEGSYLSLVSLLERIDKMERLSRVQKLSIEKQPKGEDLEIEVQMNIYFTET